MRTELKKRSKNIQRNDKLKRVKREWQSRQTNRKKKFNSELYYYSKWNRQAYGLLHLRVFATHFLSKQFFFAFFCAYHHLYSIVIEILQVMCNVILWSCCAKEKHKIQMMILWPFYCERCHCFNQIVYCVYLTLSSNYLAYWCIC